MGVLKILKKKGVSSRLGVGGSLQYHSNLKARDVFSFVIFFAYFQYYTNYGKFIIKF